MSDGALTRDAGYLARWAWAKTKDLAGVPRGRDRSFYIDQFVRRLRRGRYAPGRIAITVAGRADGAGAQAHAVMSGLCFARAFGLPYVHTPFRAVEHADGAAEIRAWEHLFNFAASADQDFEAPTVFLGDVLRDRDAGARRSIVAMPHYQRWCNENPEAYAAVAPDLRRRCRFGVSRPHGAEIVVAAHVRRGDVSQSDSALRSRYTPNAEIAAVIETVRRVLREQGSSCVVQVFSQGRPEDFADIAALGCELRLADSALTTFEYLAQADVLIMAKSSFSYAAALLSEGAPIYEPFRHGAPPPHWIVRGPGGSLDEAALRARIPALCARRAAG